MKVERHGYMFTDKHNSKGGKIATLLAAAALVLIITGVVIAYKQHGNAGIAVGILGTVSFITAMTGMIFGLTSFKEREKFYLFSWIGTIANTVIWLVICGIIAMGIMAG